MTYTFAGQFGPVALLNVRGPGAPSVPARVYIHGTATLATLYASRLKAGTVQQPIVTDANALLTFYADPGQYDVVLGTQTFVVAVPVDPSEITPSGAAGGDLTGNYPNPTLADAVVDTAELVDGAVTTAKLALLAVDTAELAAGAVTFAKLAAVTARGVVDDTTLVVGDAGQIVTMTKATPTSLTVPKNATAAFALWQKVTLINLGAGAMTIVAETGATIVRDGVLPGIIVDQYGVAFVIKISTNGWLAYGDLQAT